MRDERGFHLCSREPPDGKEIGLLVRPFGRSLNTRETSYDRSFLEARETNGVVMRQLKRQLKPDIRLEEYDVDPSAASATCSRCSSDWRPRDS